MRGLQELFSIKETGEWCNMLFVCAMCLCDSAVFIKHTIYPITNVKVQRVPFSPTYTTNRKHGHQFQICA